MLDFDNFSKVAQKCGQFGLKMVETGFWKSPKTAIKRPTWSRWVGLNADQSWTGSKIFWIMSTLDDATTHSLKKAENDHLSQTTCCKRKTILCCCILSLTLSVHWWEGGGRSVFGHLRKKWSKRNDQKNFNFFLDLGVSIPGKSSSAPNGPWLKEVQRLTPESNMFEHKKLFLIVWMEK